ncbi:MAG TPA: cupin domain-containing protein [Gillisia sp.]|nr:cupin domain-containing protein [Gillisia sp.]
MRNISGRYFSQVVCLMAFLVFWGCKEGATGKVPDKVEDEKELSSDSGEQDQISAEPWVLNIEEATLNNPHYRIEQWTGKYLQMVLMSIEPGSEIDIELHEGHDQFIRIEQGQARVLMGKTENDLSFDETVLDDWAVFIPAGYYHNIKNTGDTDLKIYTIYSPAEHAKGTLHETYEEGREH